VSDEQILEQVMGFIRARFQGRELAPEQDIFALGFVNSMFAMELVVFVESTFGFTVPVDELRLDNFRSGRSVTTLVARNLGITAP
jgi:methoxymalonate biosynthesis acyl carrier protein